MVGVYYIGLCMLSSLPCSAVFLPLECMLDTLFHCGTLRAILGSLHAIAGKNDVM